MIEESEKKEGRKLPESEYREGTITLVRRCASHGSSPVVVEPVAPRPRSLRRRR